MIVPVATTHEPFLSSFEHFIADDASKNLFHFSELQNAHGSEDFIGGIASKPFVSVAGTLEASQSLVSLSQNTI